jgi:hypothetical protein
MIAVGRPGRVTSLGTALCACVLLALTVSGAAEAATDPCFAVSAPARATEARAAQLQNPTLRAYCKRVERTIVKNKRKGDHYYSTSKQRLIVRVVRKVGHREGLDAATVSAPGSVVSWAPVRFGFGRIAKFAAKALSAVRVVVGGISKVLPQARLLRCGLFAGLGAVQSAVKGAGFLEIAVDAWFGCFLSILPEYLPPV